MPPQKLRRPSLDEAETLALQALTFLAADGERLGRFLALTGVAPSELRSLTHEAGFRLAVLEHLMGYEPLLMAFSAESGISPEIVQFAHDRLVAEAR